MVFAVLCINSFGIEEAPWKKVGLKHQSLVLACHSEQNSSTERPTAKTAQVAS